MKPLIDQLLALYIGKAAPVYVSFSTDLVHTLATIVYQAVQLVQIGYKCLEHPLL